MNSTYIQTIQERVVSILKSGNNLPLRKLASDCCSEMSRLVGYWILDELRDVEAIWQFKESDSIYLGNFQSLSKSLKFIQQFYPGKWSISEQLKSSDSEKEKAYCISIIRENLSSLL